MCGPMGWAAAVVNWVIILWITIWVLEQVVLLKVMKTDITSGVVQTVFMFPVSEIYSAIKEITCVALATRVGQAVKDGAGKFPNLLLALLIKRRYQNRVNGRWVWAALVKHFPIMKIK